MRFKLAGLAVAALLMAAPAAHANLIVNGGFETGDFTGWTVGNPYDPYTYVCGPGCGGGFEQPHSGNDFAQLGPYGRDNSLSQTMADTAGQTLVLTYWLASNETDSNNFSVDWNGHQVTSQTDIPFQQWTKYTFDVTATGSDTLAFFFRDDFGDLLLDDVSLTPASVPEPASLGLLGTALMFLAGAFVLRRKGSKAA